MGLRMRANFLGCPIDILTMQETVALAREAMQSRKRLHHVAINVAKLVNMRRDPVLAADVIGSDVVGIDGMGIVLGARSLGIPVTERVAGIDLFLELLALCAERGYRPFFLGGTSDVLQRAKNEVLKQYPNLRFAGSRDGYFTTEQEEDVVNKIRDSGADCLFIGMPTPRKERFLACHKRTLAVPFIMGVGGSFDVLAGHVHRAPAFLRAVGFEWLYRVYQEPRRMWWRYARTNTLFAVIMLRALISHAVTGLKQLRNSSSQEGPEHKRNI